MSNYYHYLFLVSGHTISGYYQCYPFCSLWWRNKIVFWLLYHQLPLVFFFFCIVVARLRMLFVFFTAAIWWS